ncbi:hypothetical protein ACHAXS_012746 [Conticribra weissflogii]
MSATYAERLSEYPDKGKCGLPENFDSKRALHIKIDQLAQLMKRSRYTVVLTGAGISTSAGIPDFRGPNGIWTKEQERKKKKKAAKGKNRKRSRRNSSARRESGNFNDDENGNSISFQTAIPTFTHRSLTHLILQPPPPPSNDENNDIDQSNSGDGDGDGDGNKEESEADTTTNRHENNKRDKTSSGSGNNINNQTYLHHIVTQNIDGLHNKTKIPRQYISILHGDIFTEKCDTCHREYIRSHEIDSIGLKHTGRHCTLGGNPPGTCPGRLKDTLLDWEDALPDEDWGRAQEECTKADLILCLGTSLRIEPAAGLCELAMVGAESSLRDRGDDYGVDVKERRAEEQEKDGIERTTGRKRRRVENLQPKPTGSKLGYVIVNLQVTPYDDDATLVIRGKVDDVMKELMKKLGYQGNWDDLHDYGKSGAFHGSDSVELVCDDGRDEDVNSSGNNGNGRSDNTSLERGSDPSASPLDEVSVAKRVNGRNERLMCGGMSHDSPEVLVIEDESENDDSTVGGVSKNVGRR